MRGRCLFMVRADQMPTSYPLCIGLEFILRVWEDLEKF